MVILWFFSTFLWHSKRADGGSSLPAQLLSVGAAAAAGLAVYVRAVLIMRIPEAEQVRGLLRRQLGRA